MNFDSTPEFERDVRALSRRWTSLESDIESVKPILETVYSAEVEAVKAELYKNFFDGKRATHLTQTGVYEFVKMRLDCSSAGAKNKVRLVFVYVRLRDAIRFVELYAKNDKNREDKQRIERCIKELEQRG